MILEIATAYQSMSNANAGMVVLEVTLPSGFVYNSELLNGLKSTKLLIKRIETKNADTMAIFYFDHLTSEPTTLKIDGYREHVVEEQKPAAVRIYDYYDNGKRGKKERNMYQPLYVEIMVNILLDILLSFTAFSAREFYSLPAIDSATNTNA